MAEVCTWGTFNSGETWVLRVLTQSLISLSPSDCGHLCSLHLTTFYSSQKSFGPEMP